MSDYCWLDIELKKVLWHSFYVCKHNVSGCELDQIARKGFIAPKDYVAFIRKYGEAHLFRRLTRDSYGLTILHKPQILSDKAATIMIGAFWLEGPAYLFSNDPAVYTLSGGKRKVAGNFHKWLRERFERCKAEYKPSEWRLVQKPAAPFTLEEQRIVQAMAGYQFSKIGTTPDKNVLIKIENQSEVVLPRLTIGIISDKISGSVRVNTLDIKPGSSKIVAVDCYKDLVSPAEVEIYKLPAPTPEDRFHFWELRDLSKRKVN